MEMYRIKKNCLKREKRRARAELTFENVKRYGIDYFGDDKIFRFCSKYIREEENEDDYLTYLCFSLLERGQYDKVTLNYLSEYYCGATKNMKKVWSIAKDYEVKTDALASVLLRRCCIRKQCLMKNRFSWIIIEEVHIFV